MKNLFPILDDSEKKRILEMHQTATKNNYMSKSYNILLENESIPFTGIMSDIKANILANATFVISKPEKIETPEGKRKVRTINLTPTSVSITTSEIQTPFPETTMRITNNEIFINLLGTGEMPVGKLDAYQQISDNVYKTFDIKIQDNELFLPNQNTKFEDDDIPEEGKAFISKILSLDAFKETFRKLLNKVIKKEKFKKTFLLPTQEIVVFEGYYIKWNISITHENSEVTELTQDKFTIESNIVIDISYSSNLPTDFEKLSDLIADLMAKNLNFK